MDFSVRNGVLSSVFCLTLVASLYYVGWNFSGEKHDKEKKQNNIFYHAAVAASQLECSIVGTDIMKLGGNAVDAAIATTLCEGVVEPYHSGIGGGAIMTFYNQTTKSTTCILSREKAPILATRNMFMGFRDARRGAKVIAVPGQLRGLEYAYNKYGGKVTWAQIFQPAIDKARNGFIVSEEMEHMLMLLYRDVIQFETNSLFCVIYCNKDKTGTKKVGEIVKNPILADTLTKIQQHGVDVFYNGDMAEDMVKEIQDDGGILIKQDLMDFDVIEKPAIDIPLPNAGYILHASSLPMGGPVLGAMLSVIDMFNITSTEYANNSVLQWHRAVEAFRHAFGARYSLGDPSFAPKSQNVENEIVSGEFARKTIEKIFDDKTFHDPAYYGAKFMNSRESSTTHISVIDPRKNVLALTTTIALEWGSYVISPSTGVIFNNVMTDFSFPTGDPAHDSELSIENQIEPGKRPLSTMTPSIFLNQNQDPVFIVGAAGGSRIPTSVAQVMFRLLYFGTDDDVESAINKKRLHDSLIPDFLEYEEGFYPEVVNKLGRLGHHLKRMKALPRVNGIQVTQSNIIAFSDPRDGGAGASGW